MHDHQGDRITRRDFVGRATLGAAGLGLGLAPGILAVGQEDGKAPRVVRDGDMVFRRLGRTELMVSELSVGGSPSPQEAVFAEALDRGMNFIDSSHIYPGGEERIGEVTRGRRDEVIICTKCHTRNMEDLTAGVVEACETALGKLKTDYIDVWCLHGIDDPQPFLSDGVQAAFEQLKEQGKIRFAGVSCHSPTGALSPLIESGKLDAALVAFNVFSGNTVKKEDVDAGMVYDNWLADSGLGGVLDLAMQHDVGVVAMKTMAGGARQDLDAYQGGDTTLAQAKLKWVLSHSAVASALSEVLSYEILEENLGAVGQALTPDDEARLREHVREMSASVCRMCGSCEAACPRNVPVPDVMRCVTYHDVHGKREHARAVYRESVGTRLSAACGDCTRCSLACPHGLDVCGQLRHAERLFA